MIHAIVITCPEREAEMNAMRRQLRDLWGGKWLAIVDMAQGAPSPKRIKEQWREAISAAGRNDRTLIVEDDVVFNRHIYENLKSWIPETGLFYGLAYNPGLELNPDGSAKNEPMIYGGQAVALNRETAWRLAANWDRFNTAPPDIEMPRFVRNNGGKVRFHAPSLVQHVGESTYGGHKHQAADFDPEWKAA